MVIFRHEIRFYIHYKQLLFYEYLIELENLPSARRVAMIYQPILKKPIILSDDIEYKLRFFSLFLDPEDERIEGSHLHDCYEIYVNISGDVKFLINSHVYSVNHGDIVLTRPNDVHVCILNSPSLHEHFCLYFKCSEDSPLLSFFNSNNFVPLLSFDKNDKNKLIDIFHAMKDADESDASLDFSLCFLSLFKILNETRSHETTDTTSHVKLPDELQEILDYINNNFTDIKYIDNIVESNYVSTTTLNRWFKKYIHLTPREYLEMKKLSYAKILLDKGKSVTDACMESGFSDCSHFISVFKKRFGKTPNKYKKE